MKMKLSKFKVFSYQELAHFQDKLQTSRFGFCHILQSFLGQVTAVSKFTLFLWCQLRLTLVSYHSMQVLPSALGDMHLLHCTLAPSVRYALFDMQRCYFKCCIIVW